MSKLKYVVRAALAVAGPVLVTGALLAPTAAIAQQKVSVAVGKPLTAAQAAIKARKWDQALNAIKQAQAIPSKTAFDDYKINELLSYVYTQQGRYGDAARVIEAQMASGMMPAGQKATMQKTLSQMYFRAGSYGKAIQYGNQYLQSSPGDHETRVLIAQAYYQQKDYKNAIATAEQAIKGGKPSESMLQLLLRSNYELKDSAGTARALDLLLRHYPSPDTWNRVIDGFLEQTKDDAALTSLYRLAEDVDALKTPRQYTDMAQVLVIGGYAAEAQRVMEKGIAANIFQGEDLSRAQRTLDSAKRRADAERKSIATADKALASAKTADEMFGVGKLYFSMGDYAKSAGAIQKAIAKGGLSNADSANMLLGIALTRAQKPADAAKAFDAVKGEKFAEIAKLWKLRGRS